MPLHHVMVVYRFNGLIRENDVRKSITSFMRQRQELEPEEARRQRRAASIKRLVGLLRALRTELGASKALPGTVLKETASLISKVESHIG